MDELDQQIFVLLLEDPFRSINDIAKILEVSFKKVNTRIDLMKEKGIIRKENKINDPIFGERVETHVSANINTNNLGLIRDHVIFYDIPNKETLNHLELFCDIHPYTTYRSKLLNNKFGLYVQFDYPPQLKEDLIQMYKYIGHILHLKFNRIIGTEMVYLKPSFFYENHLQYQNIINKNEDKTSGMIDFFWNKYNEEKKNRKLKIINQIDSLSPMDVSYLSEIQLKLLRELTINGIVSITDLSTYYDRDKSTISRHVAAIKEKYIRNGILYFKPDLNQSFNSFKLISGTFSFGN
ncbi:MAG: Lrp/AsnC family transcriptional regulator, partial [Candidatus Heimdallarchaeota archaeon]|nr:Lrp/AsnC family transcriptional regulator [Candidatus Heimdallarchaeota archaeon]